MCNQGRLCVQPLQSKRSDSWQDLQGQAKYGISADFQGSPAEEGSTEIRRLTRLLSRHIFDLSSSVCGILATVDRQVCHRWVIPAMNSIEI